MTDLKLGRTKQSSKIGLQIVPYLFLAPAFTVYAGFVIVPIVYSWFYSFYSWPSAASQPVFAGFANFGQLLQDSVFWFALFHNMLLIVLSLLTQLPIALFLAILLHWPTRGKTFFRTAFFAPMIMPTVAIAVLWSYIYLPGQGLLDQAIRWFIPNFAWGWLSAPSTALLSVFVTICWRYTGFHMVLFMAGLAAIPNELYEAARIDGAREAQVVRHVILPLLRPILAVSATLSIIGSLKYFDLVYMMAAGAPEKSRELLATYIYRLAFSSGQGRYGYGSAAAVILFATAFIVTVLLHFSCGKRAHQ